MLRGLTKEEIALCKRVFQKICDNTERCIKDKMSNTSDKPKIPDLMEAVFDTGYSEKIEHMLVVRGLQISSITMTAFHVILLYIWKRTIKEYEQ